MTARSPSPVRPNVKHKLDVLIRDRLPSGPCDLNFRPPTQHALHGAGSPLALLVKVSLAAAIIAALVRWIPGRWALTGTAGLSALAAGCVLALAIAAGLYSPEARNRPRTAVLAFVSVPLLWLAVITVFLSRLPALSLLLLTAVGFPCVAWLSDRIATHFISWQSANPRIDRRTMVAWRRDWAGRFRGMRDRRPWRRNLSESERRRVRIVLRLRRAYRRGFVWVGFCFLLAPATAVLAGGGGGGGGLRSGLWVGTEMLLGLIALAGWRLLEAPCSWGLFRQALSSWCYYGQAADRPALVFHSPAGSPLGRRLMLGAAVAVLATLLLPVIHSAAWFTPGDWRTGSLLIDALAPLAVVLLASVLWPVAVCVLAAYVLTAPAITAYHLALDAPDAYEQHGTWTELDGYADRLLQSRNPHEKNSLICGYNPTHEYPYLLDVDLLFEHMHMLGATGIGKTALGLLTLATQLIRRQDGPVIVVDAKGDRALFNSARIEAARAGRTFKWFTNKPLHSTYVFNPFGQRSLQRLTLAEVLGIVTQSLNLYHGEDYGRAWFSIAARVLLRAALLATMPEHPAHRRTARSRRGRRGAGGRRPNGPVESFRDLEELLRDAAEDDEEYKAARHLAFLVQSLCDFEQLNLSPRRDPDEPAVQHGIHMPDVIENNEVAYFFLTGMADLASVAQIARLVMYATLTAAMAHRDATGKRPRIYFLCDEAQVVVGRNIENVLAQAREYGMACILAHQTMTQLNPPGGVDLRELVTGCTSVKQIFSARDPNTQRYLSESSGAVPYLSLRWDQLKHRVVSEGEFGPQWACTGADRVMRIGVEEQLGHRLTPEDIQDVNRDANQSVFLVERGQGYSQFVGAFPMHTTWPIPHSEHLRRSFEIPWPAAGDETVTLLPDWPQPNDDTLIAQPQPAANQALLDHEVQQKLGALRDKLDPNERSP